MRTKKTRLTALALALALIAGASMTTYAAPKTMADGQTFDAEFYANTYPDVKAAYGNDEKALYNHYVTYGKNEGRLPYAGAGAATAATVATNVTYTSPSGKVSITFQQDYSSYITVSQEFLDKANKTHKYYKGISEEEVFLSEQIAKQVAGAILANPNFKTDLDRAKEAAAIVRNACEQIPYDSSYGADSKYYRSPAGVLLGLTFTCAGATRTTGRILDYMGLTWTHTNENQYLHQWCVTTLDGQKAYVDGTNNYVGYGNYPADLLKSYGYSQELIDEITKKY